MSSKVKLINRPAPYDDESFMGYILRLSELNYYSTPFNLVKTGVSWKDSKSDKASINDYIKLLSSGDIDLSGFSSLVEESIDTLESLRYPVVHSAIDHYPDIHEFFFYDVPSNYLRFAYPRVCVECLKEAPYHRSIWDFAPLTCCPKHKVLLTDLCPCCDMQLTWARKGIKYSQCGVDLTEVSPVKIDHNQYWLSNEVQYLLNYTSNDLFQVCSSETSTRRFDDIIDVLSLIDEKSKLLSDSNRKQFRYEFQWQPNIALHKLLMAMICHLDVGPYFTKRFTHTLDKTLQARAIGLKNPRSNKTLEHEITAFQRTLLNRQTETIVKTELCACLGISRRLVEGLEFHELLLPSSGPNVNAAGDYRYNLSDVVKLLSELIVQSSLELDDSVSLGQHLRFCPVADKRPFGLLLQEILKGKIIFHLPRVSTSLLDIQINNSSLAKFLKRTNKRKHSASYLTVDKVADELKTYPEAIYALLNKKLLPCIRIGKSKVVHKDHVRSFKQKFVFISELADDYSTNPTNLSEKIMDEGVKAVSGPRIDGNKVYIFNRKDIRKLDMLSVISKRGYETNTGRKPSRACKSRYQYLIEKYSLVPTSDAAKLLEISPQQLSRLIRLGYLKTESHPDLPLTKRYIRRSRIDAYEKKYIGNPFLCSLENALKSLNEEHPHFYNNWVKPKRVKVIDDGLGKLYIDLRDLKEIKKLKRKGMTTADAASYLGVERYVIQNLIKQGKIQTISGPGKDNYSNYLVNRDDIEKLTHENWW